MGLVDKAIEALSPTWAAKRARAVYMVRAYDAAKKSRLRADKHSRESANAAVSLAGDRLRAWARNLDENHDLSIGILDVLVRRIVGTGIHVEPLVLTKTGKPRTRVNKQIRELWERWRQSPDVTGEMSFSECQRLVCRSWLRDGEVMLQHVEGLRSDIQHGTELPYSIELMEADFLPFDLNDSRLGIVAGVSVNAWGRPVIYNLYKSHPGNTFSATLQIPTVKDTKQVPASSIERLKFTRRFGQVRGVSVFHGIAHRLDDLKDYEESERIAAKIGASMAGYIKKAADGSASVLNDDGDRSFEMAPGMIFDNLLPGEEVGTIGANRPNPELSNFRNAMLKACASGTGASYSSISKDYSGTYSSQRQELVESAPGYSVLRDYFIDRFVRKVYERFIEWAVTTDAISGADKITLDEMKAADFIGPGMPWIDPKKEMEADSIAIAQRLKSRHQVIRERGGDPRAVDDQSKAEREQDKADGINQAQEPSADAMKPNQETEQLIDDEAAA